MATKTYLTKAERRAREYMLRTLAREYAKEVRGAADRFGYSGTAYEHVARDLDLIHARIVAVYLGSESEVGQ